MQPERAYQELAASLSEVLVEERRRPAPGELGGLAVVHRHALLVDESVVGLVAEEFRGLAGGLEPRLEGVDHGGRAPVVAAGEVALQRDLDVGRLGGAFRRMP